MAIEAAKIDVWQPVVIVVSPRQTPDPLKQKLDSLRRARNSSVLVKLIPVSLGESSLKPVFPLFRQRQIQPIETLFPDAHFRARDTSDNFQTSHQNEKQTIRMPGSLIYLSTHR